MAACPQLFGAAISDFTVSVPYLTQATYFRLLIEGAVIEEEPVEIHCAKSTMQMVFTDPDEIFIEFYSSIELDSLLPQ